MATFKRNGEIPQFRVKMIEGMVRNGYARDFRDSPLVGVQELERGRVRRVKLAIVVAEVEDVRERNRGGRDVRDASLPAAGQAEILIDHHLRGNPAPQDEEGGYSFFRVERDGTGLGGGLGDGGSGFHGTFPVLAMGEVVGALAHGPQR